MSTQDQQKPPAAQQSAVNRALHGLSSAKDLAAKKAAVMKLQSQLADLHRKIGKITAEKNVDCGESSNAVSNAKARLETAAARIETTSKNLGTAKGFSEHAVAGKDIAFAKVSASQAESALASAYHDIRDRALTFIASAFNAKSKCSVPGLPIRF